jgi:hypothetical protein
MGASTGPLGDRSVGGVDGSGAFWRRFGISAGFSTGGATFALCAFSWQRRFGRAPWPARTSVIISRVPLDKPWRSCNRAHIRSRFSVQRPACRHCSNGVDPAMAPGFFSSTSR